MPDYFQTDLKIAHKALTEEGQVAASLTLQLSNYGDIQVVEGRDKLAEQLLRALINDSIKKSGFVLNARNTREIKTLLNLVLRRFRESQIKETDSIDNSLYGYQVYRLGSANDPNKFSKVSAQSIVHKFTDTGLYNDREYTYGVTKFYRGIQESALLEQLSITPSAYTTKQSFSIGKYFSVIGGNKQVTCYVDYNRLFSKSELLDVIDTLEVFESDGEPRRWTVNIVTKDLNRNKLSLATDYLVLK